MIYFRMMNFWSIVYVLMKRVLGCGTGLVRADRALAEEVEKAQQFIRNIHHQEQRMRPEEKVQVWEAIRRNCRESFRLLYRISTVAACLLLTLATAFWLYRMQAEKALTAIELVGKPCRNWLGSSFGAGRPTGKIDCCRKDSSEL